LLAALGRQRTQVVGLTGSRLCMAYEVEAHGGRIGI
jgi:hypothetical protein